jgi:hypothetical protein
MAFLMDVLAVSRLRDEEKELEILLLSRQLRIVSSGRNRTAHLPPVVDIRAQASDSVGSG